MEDIICRIVPLDANLKGSVLPDGSEIFFGRSPDSNVQSLNCSRKQVALVADYKEQLVCVTVCGRTVSVVDGKPLLCGESSFAADGSIVELVKGDLKYKVVFSENRKRMHDSDTSTEDTFCWEHLCTGEVLLGTHPEFDIHKKKIAAFDLDGTLIKTKSGHVFPKNNFDWTIWHDSVKPTLAELNSNGFQVLIFTNQASLSLPKGKMLLKDFKKKVETIITFLDVPVCVYISVIDGYYRKPAPGMWELMKSRIPGQKMNYLESFYVGDAAGRLANWKPGKKADFAPSDRLFALNNQIKFLTPEEFFLKEAHVPLPELKFIPNRYEEGCSLTDPEYTFPEGDENEVIIMVGSPASGKTHFVRTHLIPKEYHPVSRDTLGTWQKCVSSMKTLLQRKKKVVIDNTSPDRDSRQRYIEICREMNIKVRCFMMTTTLERCLHNNKFRKLTNNGHLVIKSHLIKNFHSSLELPTIEEGFHEIVKVPFVPLFKDLDFERVYNFYLVA